MSRSIGVLALCCAFAGCGPSQQPPTTQEPDVDAAEELCQALAEGTPCKEAVDDARSEIAELRERAHDAFTTQDVLTTIGAQAANNPLNHSRYSDAEAVAAIEQAGISALDVRYSVAGDSSMNGILQDFIALTDLRVEQIEQSRYTDDAARAAVGEVGYLTSESDPLFSSSPAAAVGSANIAAWDSAYGWGNHAQAGYLKDETDPSFAAAAAAGITSANIAAWDSAYGWGNHAQAGYLKDETDPSFTAAAAAGITSTNIASWNAAHGWGNHATVGYVTYGEFTATPGGSIDMDQVYNWNSAYGWGNHANAGYMRYGTFTATPAGGIGADQVYNWDTAHSWGNHAAAGYLKTEGDPVFSGSVAAGISVANVANWSVAYGWGNHAAQGYLKTENDPSFVASAASGITVTDISNWSNAYAWSNHADAGYLSYGAFTATPAGNIGADQVYNWDTAYGWGNHAGAGYLGYDTFTATPAGSITADQVFDWETAYLWGDHSAEGYLKTESDPSFTTSPAASITSTQVSNWDAAHGWGNHADAGYAQRDGANTFTTDQVISGGLDVANAVRVGYDATACSAANAGAIRWTGTAFEGCTGTAWRKLSFAASACADDSEEGGSAWFGRDDIVFCGSSNGNMPSWTDSTTAICAAGWHMCTAAEFTARNDNCTPSMAFGGRIDDGTNCRVFTGTCSSDLVRPPADNGSCSGAQGSGWGRGSMPGNAGAAEVGCDMTVCGVLCCK